MAALNLNDRMSPANDASLGHRIIDESHTWIEEREYGLCQDDIDDFLSTYDDYEIMPPINEPVVKYDQMSEAQREVVDLCRVQLENQDHYIKQCLIQGKAGTGKSTIIKAICQLITNRNPPGDYTRRFELMAPTGAAAVVIDAQTIHSCLIIPLSPGKMKPLRGQSLSTLQTRFRNIDFIIIDEFSMIGMSLLYKIHKRLCEARGSSRIFGGFNIYFFGDLRQLPPINDCPVYCDCPDRERCIQGKNLFKSIGKRIVLTVTHRQSFDQSAFKTALDGIGNGTIVDADWNVLMTRRMSLLADQHEREIFRNAIRIYSTNKEVKKFNEEELGRTGKPVAHIVAIHNNLIALQGTDEKAQGLQANLYISEGCRIMLRKNLCVRRGLVNGALGTVVKIVYRAGERPPELPLVLMIQFDNYHGPFIKENLFPLVPITVEWSEQEIECFRCQFPIVLAYATTIHKAQGLTIDKAVVDIGEREYSVGLTYVALSRVRRLQDLILEQYDFCRVDSIKNLEGLRRRENFMVRAGLS